MSDRPELSHLEPGDLTALWVMPESTRLSRESSREGTSQYILSVSVSVYLPNACSHMLP